MCCISVHTEKVKGVQNQTAAAKAEQWEVPCMYVHMYMRDDEYLYKIVSE